MLDDLRKKQSTAEYLRIIAALQQRRWLTEYKEYMLVIGVLGRLKMWKEALGLLPDMERNGLKPDLFSYNAVLKALERSGQWEKAVSLLSEMWAEGCSPDFLSYAQAISACGSAGRWVEALQLLAEMEKNGIKPHIMPYTAAITACAKAGEWLRAKQLLDSMPARGLTPDVFCYNAAMAAMAKTERWEMAIEMLQEMRANEVPPDTVVYNTAINACKRCRKGRATLGLLIDMLDQKVDMDTSTYNNAITACALSSLRQEAMELVEELNSDSSLDLDKMSYSASIRAHDDDWPQALALLEEMRKTKVTVDQVAYSAAIAACARAKEPELAQSVLREMKLDFITPDIIAYNSAMSAADKAEQWQLALALFEEARAEDGVEPDRISFNTVLSACWKGFDGNEKEAQQERGKQGVARQTIRLFEDMRKNKVRPGEYAYRVALAACERSGKASWERAIHYVNTMHLDHVQESAPMLLSAFKACEYAGRHDLKVHFRAAVPQKSSDLERMIRKHTAKMRSSAGRGRPNLQKPQRHYGEPARGGWGFEGAGRREEDGRAPAPGRPSRAERDAARQAAIQRAEEIRAKKQRAV